MKNLTELFEDMLQDVYFAEKTILKALPKMAKKSSSAELTKLFEAHLHETKGQVERLEQVFEIAGLRAKGKTCHAIEGLVEEAGAVMEEAENDDTRHVGMLADAQAIEHYEMARYRTLISWATQLKLTKAVKLLEETLAQEEAADQKLSMVGVSLIEKADASSQKAA
jgi:ferritin-like metal-binding protein YciE